MWIASEKSGEKPLKAHHDTQCDKSDHHQVHDPVHKKCTEELGERYLLVAAFFRASPKFSGTGQSHIDRVIAQSSQNGIDFPWMRRSQRLYEELPAQAAYTVGGQSEQERESYDVVIDTVADDLICYR